jgi:hypothetical protein
MVLKILGNMFKHGYEIPDHAFPSWFILLRSSLTYAITIAINTFNRLTQRCSLHWHKLNLSIVLGKRTQSSLNIFDEWIAFKEIL